MIVEPFTVITLLLAVPQAAAQGGSHPTRSLTVKLQEKERLLAQLQDLQARVRSGDLPTASDLALAATSREEIVAGIDVHGAMALGMEPAKVRDRLAPGFTAEIEQLAEQRSRLEVGPPARPSPMLTLLLNFEQELASLADRRRQRLGIESPIVAGPLGQKLEPVAKPPPMNEAAGSDGTSVAVAVDPAATPGTPAVATAAMSQKPVDARITGEALYRAGRYADALTAWSALAIGAGETMNDATVELDYQRADCFMRTDKVDDAIKIWEMLANDHAKTTWGAQAGFSLKIARTLAALEAAKKSAGRSEK